jgi:hypothetical protein
MSPSPPALPSARLRLGSHTCAGHMHWTQAAPVACCKNVLVRVCLVPLRRIVVGSLMVEKGRSGGDLEQGGDAVVDELRQRKVVDLNDVSRDAAG